MNQLQKTLTFVGVAVVLALTTYLMRPAPFNKPPQSTGERLFPEIDDAAAARRLTVVRYDKVKEKPADISVARKGAKWRLASHNNYPADGSGVADRVRNAVISIKELEVVQVATNQRGQHAMFGVISPDSEQAESAEKKDIGTRIALSDEGGEVLADLIVGKKVQGFEGQRFVRLANDDDVYAVEIDLAGFPTDLDKWIATDLLELKSWNLRRVMVRDYSVRLRPAAGGNAVVPELTQRLVAMLKAEQSDPQWELVRLIEPRGGRPRVTTLRDDEELNAARLNEMKSALDDLKIVDVETISDDVREAIKNGELTRNEKLLEELTDKGFTSSPDGGELFSNNGELSLTDDTGVQYVLRFGAPAAGDQQDGTEIERRYLFVSAQVDEDFFQPEAPATPAADPGDGGPLAPLQPPAGGASGQEGVSGEAGGDGAEPPADDVDAESQPPADGGDQPADDSDNTSSEEDDPPPFEIKPPDSIDLTQPLVNPEEESPEAKAAAEREEKRQAAEEKAKELNEKFGGWYYVISEDVYQKLHLGRDDIIREKQADADDAEAEGMQ